MTDDLEVLSALVDGEPVDPVALVAALAVPDAARALVDFAALRALARRDLDEGQAAVVDRTPWRPAPRSWWRVAAAAAVLAVVALAGYSAGRFTGGSGAVADRLAGADTEEAAVASDAAPPRPTRVLRFELGTEWKRIS